MSQNRIAAGFTLIEMIIVIVITGIIGSMVAVFLSAPIKQYMDVSHRAELTDIADTALRRLTRDIRTAVPNSVRIVGCGSTPCIEFLPTRTGGRYRAVQNCMGVCSGNVLTFGATVSSFDIMGSAINFVASDYIVIGSTQSNGNPPYDTSAAGILRAYTGAAGPQTTVIFSPSATALPVWAELSSQRFDVVDGVQQAVTYACVGTLGALDGNQNGRARLMRYWGYGFNASQVAPPTVVGGATGIGAVGHSEAVLADKVSGCNIIYDVPSQRAGLVAISLTLTDGGESVSLYHEVHVNNSP